MASLIEPVPDIASERRICFGHIGVVTRELCLDLGGELWTTTAPRLSALCPVAPLEQVGPNLRIFDRYPSLTMVFCRVASHDELPRVPIDVFEPDPGELGDAHSCTEQRTPDRAIVIG